jgi:hypothetical protein
MTHHSTGLHVTGLVSARREGREVRFSVRPERLQAASEVMAAAARPRALPHPLVARTYPRPTSPCVDEPTNAPPTAVTDTLSATSLVQSSAPSSRP